MHTGGILRYADVNSIGKKKHDTNKLGVKQEQLVALRHPVQ